MVEGAVLVLAAIAGLMVFLLFLAVEPITYWLQAIWREHHPTQ